MYHYILHDLKRIKGKKIFQIRIFDNIIILLVSEFLFTFFVELVSELLKDIKDDASSSLVFSVNLIVSLLLLFLCKFKTAKLSSTFDKLFFLFFDSLETLVSHSFETSQFFFQRKIFILLHFTKNLC